MNKSAIQKSDNLLVQSESFLQSTTQENQVNTDLRIHNLDIFIFGCGIVGGALIEQIKQQQTALLAKHGIDIKVFGISNSTQFIINENGINLQNWQQQLNEAELVCDLDNLRAFIKDHELTNPVIIDCTGSYNVAMQYPFFLANNMHVVTANKIANGENMDFYRTIRKLAEDKNKKFLYETNIGAGLPVIEPLQKLLKAGDELYRFEGILSGSLSYIFGELHQGLTLSEATLKAKGLGYTEPDPREDLNGMDVARKVLIIAREIGMEIDIDDIVVESVIPDEYEKLNTAEDFLQRLPELDEKFTKRVQQAESQNKVLRYVANITDGRCKVAIDAVDESNPLYGIYDGENVLAFYSKYYQPKPLVIRGYGAGPVVTAAGVFSDVLRIIE